MKPRGECPRLSPTEATKKAGKAPANPALPNDAFKERLIELRTRGFNRLYQNGKIVEFSTPESLLDLDFGQALYALVDRLVVSADNRARIVDAAEIGFRETGEIVYETVPRDEETEPQRLRFSQAFECKLCHRIYREPEPRLFSFNNPYGACERCQGFGNTIDFDLNLIIPDKQKTLNDGAIDPWTRPKYRPYQSELRKAAHAAWHSAGHAVEGTDAGAAVVRARWARIFPRRAWLLRFSGAQEIQAARARDAEQVSRLCDVPGVQRNAAARRSARGAHQRAAISARFPRSPSARQTSLFEGLTLTPQQQEIAGGILVEIQQRLHFLDAVGLEYITLDRLASTLSGGEAQRIQLATSLGSRLVGALYVLDEPSIGLHSRDTAKLIRILEELRDLGNTILVVEHDPDVIRAADWLVDLGPGAGELGGRILASGTVDEVERNPDSLTGRYLSGQLTIPIPTRRREPHAGEAGIAGRADSQPERARCRDSHGHAGLHYRCFRLGQIHPGA